MSAIKKKLTDMVNRILPPHRRMQLRFLLKQIPSLPGRYKV